MAELRKQFVQSFMTFKICLFFTFVVCLLQTIGVATKYWYIFEYDRVDSFPYTYRGLFYQCGHGFDNTLTCTPLLKHPHVLTPQFIAVQVLEVLGLAVIVASLCCLTGQLLVRNKSTLLVLGIAIPLLAGTLITTGTVVFVAQAEARDRGDSFHLSALAGVLSLLVAVPAFMNRQDSAKSTKDTMSNRNVDYLDQGVSAPSLSVIDIELPRN